jgi:hypothetical protein
MTFYKKNEWEFYDLKIDPMEMNNLYENEEYKELTASLKTDL